MGIYINNVFVPNINITLPGIMPSGILSISSGGITNVYNYKSININIKDDFNNYLLNQSVFNTNYENLRATKINPYTFFNCYSLASINLPNCVSIGSGAFRECTSLASINLSNCNYINDHAFYGCSTLATINLPNCISIGSGAFEGCKALTSITLPKCKYIESSAFYDCRSLI